MTLNDLERQNRGFMDFLATQVYRLIIHKVALDTIVMRSR